MQKKEEGLFADFKLRVPMGNVKPGRNIIEVRLLDKYGNVSVAHAQEVMIGVEFARPITVLNNGVGVGKKTKTKKATHGRRTRPTQRRRRTR